MYEKSNIVRLKGKKYRHKYRINFTYVNLGLLMLFLCNLSSVYGHCARFCGSLFVRCCFLTSYEARQITVRSLNSQIKEQRTDSA